MSMENLNTENDYKANMITFSDWIKEYQKNHPVEEDDPSEYFFSFPNKKKDSANDCKGDHIMTHEEWLIEEEKKAKELKDKYGLVSEYDSMDDCFYLVKEKDNVNHPSHYTQGKIECIDAIEAATEGLTGIEAFCTGNALKYIWRWKDKNGIEDIDKTIWYLERLKSYLQEALGKSD